MPRPRRELPPEAARRLRRLTERLDSTDDALRAERAELMHDLVAQGYSRRAIADACGITHPSVLHAMATRPQVEA